MSLQTTLDKVLSKRGTNYNELMKKVWKNPKYFIINYGPPASGKGTMKRKL